MTSVPPVSAPHVFTATVDDDVTAGLLDAAIAVFAEKGFERAGVAEIARRAGLTTGAIYSRWSGKQGLMLDAVELVLSHELDGILAGNQVTAATDILATLGDHLVEQDHDRSGDAIVLEAFAMARREPEFADMMARRLEDQEGRLAKIVLEGRADGLVDAELSVDAIVALCHAIGLGFSLLRTVQRPMPAAEEWNELIGRLIAAAAPPPSDHSTRTQGDS